MIYFHVILVTAAASVVDLLSLRTMRSRPLTPELWGMKSPCKTQHYMQCICSNIIHRVPLLMEVLVLEHTLLHYNLQEHDIDIVFTVFLYFFVLSWSDYCSHFVEITLQ